HSGLDIGGSEGLVEVTAATDGLIVSAGNHVLPELGDTPIEPRYDVVYILDHRGWYYRYSHLQMIAVDVIPGRKVQQGQLIGRLGKEGASGGWTHLHFEIKSRQPSGRWGTQEAYAFLWEAYIRQFSPERIAVARPGHHVLGGETVVLDGSKSWSAQGPIARYEWILADGRTATGAKVEQRYDRPGTYSEVLKIVDASGQAAFDFARVTVVNPVQPSVWPIRLHATYYPTFGLQAGDPVTFKVRAFGSTHGEEVWDLGDGSPPQTTRSDGNVQALAKDGYAVLTHRYRQAGDYLVLVQRQDRDGTRAMAHLHVHVE
ncbi:MAG: PKD domain-containing protein, partial [Pirellulaceae bacterium]